jgi:hypothetical protein
VNAAGRGSSEQEFVVSIALLVAGAVAALLVAALIVLDVLPGGSIAALAACICAILALLGARRLARLRSRAATDAADGETVPAPEGLSPWVAYGPPILISGTIAAAFGYLVGGGGLALLLGIGTALLVFHGLRAPPLEATSRSPILRTVRRLTRHLR